MLCFCVLLPPLGSKCVESPFIGPLWLFGRLLVDPSCVVICPKTDFALQVLRSHALKADAVESTMSKGGFVAYKR